jgi:hypothetical protein
MTDWFARPVLRVTDVEASLPFYVNRLGLTSPWALRGGRQCARCTGRPAGLPAYPGRHGAGEDWQGSNVHFRERRAGDARGRDRCVGRAARGTRGQGRFGQGGFVGLPAPGGR